MGFCDMCQSAGSVNVYGLCEVCGTEVELEDTVVRTAEVAVTA